MENYTNLFTVKWVGYNNGIYNNGRGNKYPSWSLFLFSTELSSVPLDNLCVIFLKTFRYCFHSSSFFLPFFLSVSLYLSSSFCPIYLILFLVLLIFRRVCDLVTLTVILLCSYKVLTLSLRPYLDLRVPLPISMSPFP